MRSRSAQAREPLSESALFEYSIGSLSRRMRSERDLERLMRQRAEPGPAGAAAVARVIARLKELRYLSDDRYAQDFARLRRDNQSHGARRVRQDLLSRGISKQLVEGTLEESHPREDELALARQFVERKRLSKPENEKETARFVGRLLRNGFQSTTVWRLLREWHIEVDALANEEDSSIDAADA